MVTLYRIVVQDKEVYRGKRSAIVRKLATLSRRVALESFSVQQGEAEDYTQEPANWSASVPAADFLTHRP